MPERPSSPTRFPILSIVFLSGTAFGSVCPLLYFLFALPVWIGVLIAVDSAGRILGRLLVRRYRSEVLNTSVLALSYVLLVAAAYPETRHPVAIFLVYLWCFLAAVGASGYPSIRLLISQSEDGDRAGLTALCGFALGCALTAMGNDYHLVNAVVDPTALIRPAWLALGLSASASVLAVVFHRRLRSNARSARLDAGTVFSKSLVMEAAFTMTVCVVPLLSRETYSFTPVRLARVIAVAAGVSAVTQRIVRAARPSPALIRAGILLTCAGSAAFILGSRLSRSHGRFADADLRLAVFWLGAAITAAGHGLLRIFFSNSLESADETSQQPEPALGPRRSADLRSANLRSSNLRGAITGLTALFATAIWPDRETTSYAIPLLLAIFAFAQTL
jgi:hypothetical protein